ncbi:MAG: penicillin-insensitive murein endopeptidase [Myxococcales bacterium]|nr:penicillin-insensitive murein endopeptidase [Myxococcales bacterium]MCB9754320.1 penicillin-insensitive murein endopeptidase [Myxococcales bacterium]
MGLLTAMLVLLSQGDAAGEATSTDPLCTRWITETRVLEEPELVKHTVAPKERVSQIAIRYGVTREHIVELNKLKHSRVSLRKGRTIKVEATRIPPPREEITYTVQDGEDWFAVAIKHRVASNDLRSWNWRTRGKPLTAGQEISVWIDPGRPRTVNCKRGPAPPPLEFRDDATSYGRPQYGRLKNGIRLPESPLWTRRPTGLNVLWASSHTIENLEKAFRTLRVDVGYEGEIMIGSISRQRGGRFPPHKSHRTGLDIDIRLPLVPGVPPNTYPRPDAVDWPALWELIEALVDTGEVSMIFFDWRLQKHLYAAAREEGVTEDELRPILHWPRREHKWEAIVRHSHGHKGHIHVRFLCGVNEARCGPSRAHTLLRRGWIEPHPSGKESREGATARREQWRKEGRYRELSDEDGDEDEGE